MLGTFFNQYLIGESTNELIEESVEPTSEGLDFEMGGFEIATELAEQSSFMLGVAHTADQMRILQQSSNLSEATENMEALAEASVKGVFQKIKDIIKKMWKRLTEVMNTVINYFTKLASDTKFIQRVKSQLQDYNKSVTLQGYKFTINAVDPKKSYDAMVNSVKGKFSAVNTKEALDNATNFDAIDSYVKTGFGFGKTSFENDLFKALRNGSDSQSEVTFNKQSLISAVEGYKTSVSVVKSAKVKIDSVYSSAIKQVDNLASENNKIQAKTDADKEKQSIKSAVYKQEADMLKNLLSYTNKAVSAQVSALKAERSQAKNALMQALKDSKKTAESTELGESTEFESYTGAFQIL